MDPGIPNPADVLKTLPPKWRFSRHATITIVVVIVVAVIAILVGLRYFAGNKSGVNILIPGRVSKVEVKTEYKNPFDRENQFVNPFAEVKSPFNNLQ